ncbi:MAG TPA: M50 family metallopeptidase [Solirubrobacter sp.]|nr:M50 family metallopeptidase [Solirubrobacter sp.]
MSWALAFLGFAALVILHELGHFTAAKAVGMRVERFSLFFPPLIARHKRGETEYAIGAIPLGGYVKITGMNPAEEIPPEHAHRAYYRQPVWKRVVVIAAGPAVNIVLAFAILAGVYLASGTAGPPPVIGTVEPGTPAAHAGLKSGDAVIAVDGKKPKGDTLLAQLDEISPAIAAHKGTPVTLTVKRDGRELTVTGKTFYDAANKKYRFGFSYDPGGTNQPAGPVRAAGLAVDQMWTVTSKTVSTIARVFQPAQRKQIGSVVGGYNETRKAFALDAETALVILAFISLSLGVINLFPFLPLDGGHIFWALAEKVRGRAIPFSVMERAGFVGFALVIALFVIGFTNDLDRIANGGYR